MKRVYKKVYHNVLGKLDPLPKKRGGGEMLRTRNRGRSRIFIGGGGGAEDYVRASTSRARSPKSLTTRREYQKPEFLPGISRVFDALSCYLTLIIKHCDTKWDKKNT